MEAHHVRQALALTGEHWIAFLVHAEGADLAVEAAEPIPATSRHQFALRSEIVVLLQVEDGRLREQEVFPNVLSVISALRLFLVHFIDESLDLVGLVAAEIHTEADAAEAWPLLAVAPFILRGWAEELCLEQRWQFRDLEVLAVFRDWLAVTVSASLRISSSMLLSPALALLLCVLECIIHPDAVEATACVSARRSLGRRLA